jgi:hypothetical protein
MGHLAPQATPWVMFASEPQVVRDLSSVAAQGSGTWVPVSQGVVDGPQVHATSLSAEVVRAAESEVG